MEEQRAILMAALALWLLCIGHGIENVTIEHASLCCLRCNLSSWNEVSGMLLREEEGSIGQQRPC